MYLFEQSKNSFTNQAVSAEYSHLEQKIGRDCYKGPVGSGGTLKGKLQILLSKILQTSIVVEKVSVRKPGCGKKTASGIILILQMQIKEQVADSAQTRIIELDICESSGDTYSKIKKLGSVSFCLNYYCVEAPAILIDSGVTKIRIAYDTFVERYIGEAFA